MSDRDGEAESVRNGAAPDRSTVALGTSKLTRSAYRRVPADHAPSQGPFHDPGRSSPRRMLRLVIVGYLMLWLIYIAGIAVLVAYEDRLGRNAFAVIGWVTLLALATLTVWTSYAARQIFNYLRVVRHAPQLVAFLLAVLYYLACIPFGFVLVPHAHRLTTTHHLEPPDGTLPVPFLWDPD